MTTIAWDGRELAGDRMATIGGTPIPYRKVFRVTAPNGRRALVGYSGSGAFVGAHLNWLRGGERPAFAHERFNWGVLLIDDAGIVWHRCAWADYWERLRVRNWALGSGADYALAAMALGRSAREAVRLAHRLDHQTGLGVDVVCFI